MKKLDNAEVKHFTISPMRAGPGDFAPLMGYLKTTMERLGRGAVSTLNVDPITGKPGLAVSIVFPNPKNIEEDTSEFLVVAQQLGDVHELPSQASSVEDVSPSSEQRAA